MPAKKMSKEAREIELGIKKQKLTDDIKKYVADGNPLYDWQRPFKSRAISIKASYERLTGEKISMLDFFVSMGFSAEDFKVPKEVRRERILKANKATSIEGKVENLISELNDFIGEGNDISTWRQTKFNDKVIHIKKLYEKHYGLKLSNEDFFRDVLGFENASEFAPSNDTKLERRRQQVINVLNEYIKENGSLSGWRKVPGLRGRVCNLQAEYKKLEGREIPIDELFLNYFGLEYDAEYLFFSDKMEELSKYADETGCIDVIRNNELETPESVLYRNICKRARRVGMSVFDYTLLVTDYYFSVGYVPGNYVDYVKMLLEDDLPNNTVEGLSITNRSLYDKLWHLSTNSLFESMSIKEVLENIFGVDAESFNLNNNGRVKSDEQILADEQKLVEKLRLYADKNGDVAGISLKNPKLYRELCTITRGETPQMFLERHGLTNSNSAERRARFSGIPTTYEARQAELFPIREQIIAEGQSHGKYNFDEMTDVQKYHARLEIAQKTIVAYYSQLGLQEYSGEFFEQKTGDGAESEDCTVATLQETAGTDAEYQENINDSSLYQAERELLESSVEKKSPQDGRLLVQEFLQRKYGSEANAEVVKDQPVIEDTDGKID